MKDKELLVERYLTGKLNLYELEMVEKDIKTNIDFENYVKRQRNILLGIREFKKVQFKEMLNSVDVEEKKTININRFKQFSVRYSAVASVVFIIGLTISILYYSSKPAIPNSKMARRAVFETQQIN